MRNTNKDQIDDTEEMILGATLPIFNQYSQNRRRYHIYKIFKNFEIVFTSLNAEIKNKIKEMPEEKGRNILNMGWKQPMEKLLKNGFTVLDCKSYKP